MGLPGVAVAACFAIASTSFIVAIAHTTVANVVLMQAGVPLIAALLAFLLFRERVAPATWAAIAAVICGVAIMVSESFDGSVSPIGDGLAVLIAFAFSIATVITRRYSHVRMTPAMPRHHLRRLVRRHPGRRFRGVGLRHDLAVRLRGAQPRPRACLLRDRCAADPCAFTALLGTFETLLSPVWVWLFHGEIPSTRTLLGGAVIFTALLVHIALEFQRMSRPQRAGVTGLPSPN